MVHGWPRLATTIISFTRPLRLYFLLFLITHGFLGSSSFEIARNKILGRFAGMLGSQPPSSRHHSRYHTLPPDVVVSILLSAPKAGTDMDLKGTLSSAFKDSLSRLRKDPHSIGPWAPASKKRNWSIINPNFSRAENSEPLSSNHKEAREENEIMGEDNLFDRGYFESTLNLEPSRTGEDAQTSFLYPDLSSSSSAFSSHESDSALPESSSSSSSSASTSPSSPSSSNHAPLSPVHSLPATAPVVPPHASSSFPSSSSSSSFPSSSSSSFPSSSSDSSSSSSSSSSRSASSSSPSSSSSFPSSSSASSSSPSSPSSPSSSFPSASSDSSSSFPTSSSSSTFSSSSASALPFYSSPLVGNDYVNFVESPEDEDEGYFDSFPGYPSQFTRPVKNCDPQQFRNFCLHGGQCVHLSIMENDPTCICTRGWKGRRCQEVDYDSYFDEEDHDLEDEEEEEEEEEEEPYYRWKWADKSLSDRQKKNTGTNHVGARVQLSLKTSARW